MKTIADAILAGRARISEPVNWTQGELARDEQGHPVGEDSPEATCWCATGALLQSGVREPSVLFMALGLFENANGSLPSFNDTHTHAEVLELFDRAIVACNNPKQLLNPPYFLNQ